MNRIIFSLLFVSHIKINEASVPPVHQNDLLKSLYCNAYKLQTWSWIDPHTIIFYHRPASCEYLWVKCWESNKTETEMFHDGRGSAHCIGYYCMWIWRKSADIMCSIVLLSKVKLSMLFDNYFHGRTASGMISFGHTNLNDNNNNLKSVPYKEAEFKRNSLPLIIVRANFSQQYCVAAILQLPNLFFIDFHLCPGHKSYCQNISTSLK